MTQKALTKRACYAAGILYVVRSSEREGWYVTGVAGWAFFFAPADNVLGRSKVIIATEK